MKLIKLSAFFMTIAFTMFGCKKGGGGGGSDCQDNHTTEVVFTNTGSVPLLVEVAIQLTPQFTAINPVVKLDLAPGATATREISATKYFIVWNRDCATTCAMVTYYSKTYTECNTYEEKRGI